jgi:hypothetical protein
LNKRLILGALAAATALAGLALAAQFLPEELAQRETWEKFLETAEIVASRQMVGPEAVTSPWVLTLKLGGTEHRGLWKNPEGRMSGFWEGWTYEIAAYRIDKLIGLGLVPPTVERRFQGDRGSCQYWVDDCISLKEREAKGIRMPPAKVFGWNRATYLQRLFDNLIANEDRHTNQILITKDWRMILIDHSRSFRTSAKFTKGLIFSARSPQGPMLMSELPRAVYDRVKALDFAAVRKAVGEYLSDEEIRAVLARRDLILVEIARLIQVNGEDKVFY